MQPQSAEMNIARAGELIRHAVSTFGLSLERYGVLTEAASHYFSLTPLLAALGGARKVYAMTSDSRWGSVSEIAEVTMGLAREWGVEQRIEIVTSRQDTRLGDVDIVTNLGFVRPIDRALLERMKQSIVVPLMWETWEFRPQDLDLDACRSLGIPVLGTDEHHPDLNTFAYIGLVALKLLFELEIEVFKSNILVLGSGEFRDAVTRSLKMAGATPRVIDTNVLEGQGVEDAIRSADAMVVVEHHDRRELIGDGGCLSAHAIKQINPALAIAHICGSTSQPSLERAGIRFRPTRIAPAGFMSATAAYVGPKPLIDLHAAGLRVGQAMADAASKGLRGLTAEKWALDHCEYAQGFDGRH